MASKLLLCAVLQSFLLVSLLANISDGFHMPLSWRRFGMGENDITQCLGMMGNRDLYEGMTRICSDCQNIFRDKGIESKCRSDCFNSSYFETCVLALELTEKLTDYKMHASILKQGKK